MCYEIDSSVIIANLLKYRDECSLIDLIELKVEIEKISSEIYVDLTKNSICSSVENNPSMFIWENENIHKTENSEAFFETEFLEICFNKYIDNSVREEVVSLLEILTVE